MKAIDIWNLLILTFAFIAILHSAIVTSSALKEHDVVRSRTYYNDEMDEKTRWLSETPYYAQLPEEQPKTIAKICDYVFRILFPVAFLAASTVYFLQFLKPYLK
ncbi:unnamed protein product [Anisakis simplex]|uniref:Uncharacterized protein n=1 Tax=Anisakis simplex TaxID=6269 RepID=A0A3P6SN78_ANISI|nr:unnamed protein product [Anisakis simplex]